MPQHITSTSFKAGLPTANPGGRPKSVHEVSVYARRYALEMIDGLIKLARTGENGAIRKAAMTEVLDRGLGKAPQSFDHHVVKDIDKMSLEELRDLRERLSGVAAMAMLAPPPADDLFSALQDEQLGPRIELDAGGEQMTVPE